MGHPATTSEADAGVPRCGVLTCLVGAVLVVSGYAARDVQRFAGGLAFAALGAATVVEAVG